MKVKRFFIFTISILILIPITYGLISFIASFISTEKVVSDEKNIEIFIVSNPIHTEFLLPVNHELMRWLDFFDKDDFKNNVEHMGFISVGWGDKRFFFEMPTWDEFTLELGFSALLYPTESVLHVDFYQTPYKFQTDPKRIKISSDQYQKIINHIKESFILKDGRPVLYEDKGYYQTDNFYHANEVFHLFNTCNMWTNRGLKKMGVKTSIWSPTKIGILRYLD